MKTTQKSPSHRGEPPPGGERAGPEWRDIARASQRDEGDRPAPTERGVLYAPGWPGAEPSWTTSAKDGAGTALSGSSRCWFTLAQGIVTEVYFPRLDRACLRDLGLLVSDGHHFAADERTDTEQQVQMVEPGVPAYRVVNVDHQGRYRIEKQILSDPRHDALVQRIRFQPHQGRVEDYQLYALLSPRLGDQGWGNTAWLGNYKGVEMLFAQRADNVLALACSSGWRKRSVGFVGISDAWQDVMRHKQMTWQYTRAENGHVALAGQVDLRQAEFVLALGLGENAATAALKAILSLEEDPERILEWYTGAWRSWQGQLLPLDVQSPQRKGRDLYRVSAAVLETHRSLELSGGGVASLTVPWGQARTDSDPRGYQRVWTRDLVESVSGLLAAGSMAETRNTLRYLQGTQEPDGHWPQMMQLDGVAHGVQVQMDESALPVLLAALGHRERAIDDREMQRAWPMLRAAALYTLRRGPTTPGDRWENAAGYSPYTLATEIAALVVAAELAKRLHEKELATFMLETADAWNSAIEEWTYLRGTEMARRVGVDGYYLRIMPPDGDASQPLGSVPELPAAEVVSPDALALVRFGLRRADDPRIVNTLRVIDANLRVQTPYGPCWRRYSGDHYGEQDDGTPFPGYGDRQSHGRCWPLLTGERSHYELAAGHIEEARQLLATMSQFANPAGMIPEQVWDAPDLPDKGLFCGRASGSAMPLAWAHGEYVKLRRSIRDGRVFDLPEPVYRRYVVEKKVSPRVIWRFTHQIPSMPSGKRLRIETRSPARVRFSLDAWHTVRDQETTDTHLGLYFTDLPTETLGADGHVHFTFFWPQPNRWEGRDFVVRIDDHGTGRYWGQQRTS